MGKSGSDTRHGICYRVGWVFEEDVLAGAEFRGRNFGRRRRTPEERLWIAVLESAVAELRDPPESLRHRHAEAYIRGAYDDALRREGKLPLREVLDVLGFQGEEVESVTRRLLAPRGNGQRLRVMRSKRI